jgi:hypothetical protein
LSITDTSPIGLPQSLKYDQLPSIPDGVNSYSVNVAPSGLASITGTPTSAGIPIFVQNKAGLVNQLFNTQKIALWYE